MVITIHALRMQHTDAKWTPQLMPGTYAQPGATDLVVKVQSATCLKIHLDHNT